MTRADRAKRLFVYWVISLVLIIFFTFLNWWPLILAIIVISLILGIVWASQT